MAGKKMFPPREVDDTFGKTYDEVNLRIGFCILAGQIVMRFSDQVEWIRMSSAGARRLATLLIREGQRTRPSRRRGKSP
jgi:hypothetical protein